MARLSLRTLIGSVLSCAALSVSAIAQGPPPADGGQPSMGSPPAYQRNAFDGNRRNERWDRRDFRRGYPYPMSPQISAGWFQRPYPYHLDYYRMRYGGSYAPYFGNLYGTPQVVNYPPYYGPYYTGYGPQYPMENGPGYGGAPAGYPAAPGAVMPQGEVEQNSPVNKPAEKPATKSSSDSLPPPSPSP